MQIAYYFDFDRDDGRDLGYVAPVLAKVQAWADSGPRGVLAVRPHPDGSAVVIDTRDGTRRTVMGWSRGRRRSTSAWTASRATRRW